MFLLNLCIIAVALLLAWEDFKSRSIHLLLFPLFSLLLIVNTFFQTLLKTFFWNFIYDLTFLVIQFILLTGYMYVKKKRKGNVLNEDLGLGDVLLLLSFCFYFSFLSYLAFYVFSLLLVVISWGVFSHLKKPQDSRIPLAGIQAVIFVFVFIVGWMWPYYRLNDDAWIISKLLL